MRKAFACAFVLFMFASSTTALAGSKRFCGFIAPNEGKNGNTTIGVGAWMNNTNFGFDNTCKHTRNSIKRSLKADGDWGKHDWRSKDGYKCGKISDFFTNGRNICGKKGYMKIEEQYYSMSRTGDNPATFEISMDGSCGVC